MSRNDLMDFPVLVPPRAEQTAIATFLDRETAKIDALVDDPYRSLAGELDAARRALFLMRGMPVAEDNNLRYALAHQWARRYSLRGFLAWLETPGPRPDEPQPRTAPCPASGH